MRQAFDEKGKWKPPAYVRVKTALTKKPQSIKQIMKRAGETHPGFTHNLLVRLENEGFAGHTICEHCDVGRVWAKL